MNALEGGFEMRADEAIPIGDLQRGAHLAMRAGSVEIETKRRLPNGVWYQLTVNYDGSGLRLFVNGKLEPVEARQVASVTAGALRTAKGFKGQLDDLRIYGRQLSEPEIAELTNAEPARATLLLASTKRSKEQDARLRDYFLSYAAAEPFRSDWTTLKALKVEKEKLDAAIRPRW